MNVPAFETFAALVVALDLDPRALMFPPARKQPAPARLELEAEIAAAVRMMSDREAAYARELVQGVLRFGKR